MLDLVWLVPALPLAGFLLIVLFGRKLGDPFAGVLATAMTAASFAVVNSCPSLQGNAITLSHFSRGFL